MHGTGRHHGLEGGAGQDLGLRAGRQPGARGDDKGFGVVGHLSGHQEAANAPLGVG